MENLWEIISGAPWWVYALFAYLVSIGIQSIQPRTLPIKRLILMPVLFVVWSIYSLYGTFSMFPSLAFYWVALLALGAYLGFKEVRSWHFHSDHQKRTLTIPGNYSTLILILLIFVLKFFWGYLYATRTEISYWIYLSDTLTSALVTGFFVGRAAVFLKRYYK
ncbi:MAG: hypothetical protein HYX67_02165 [Candidatus Melainabacteria bacterium]|nr:hypothetical protein [Candidatus Melainabacteria bacterium]